jgi:hypothetical protein
MPAEERLDRLQKQLEYYFSRQNLSSDHFLVSQMNSELFVPLPVLAKFPKVKALLLSDPNEEAVVKTLADVCGKSKDLVLDAENSKVRPNFKLARNTILLRNIPSDAPNDRVREFISKFCTSPHQPSNVIKALRADIADNWYVEMEREEDALNVIENIRMAGPEWGTEGSGQYISARLKSESLLKTTSTASRVASPILSASTPPSTVSSRSPLQQQPNLPGIPPQPAQNVMVDPYYEYLAGGNWAGWYDALPPMMGPPPGYYYHHAPPYHAPGFRGSVRGQPYGRGYSPRRRFGPRGGARDDRQYPRNYPIPSTLSSSTSPSDLVSNSPKPSNIPLDEQSRDNTSVGETRPPRRHTPNKPESSKSDVRGESGAGRERREGGRGRGGSTTYREQRAPRGGRGRSNGKYGARDGASSHSNSHFSPILLKDESNFPSLSNTAGETSNGTERASASGLNGFASIVASGLQQPPSSSGK